MTFRLPILAALALLLCGSQPVRAEETGLPARLEALAGQGNAEALYHLGMIYHLGLEGVARDPRRALGYFRRSAEGGDPLGAYKLGCYYAGQGEGVVAEDPELALRYKLIAAEAGYDRAQLEVAQIYDGREDADRAVRWLEAAARQGNVGAAFGAMVYRSSDGPLPDRARALLYFELVRRDMAEFAAHVGAPSGAEEAAAMLRPRVETGVTDADRARATQLIAAWREEQSAVTLKADLGMNAARRLVGLPDAAST